MGSKQSSERHEDDSVSYESIQEDWPWVWAIRNCIDGKGGLSATQVELQEGRQRRLPVKITDQVLLGNVACVERGDLEELGITAVLNAAGPWALRKRTVESFKHRCIIYKRLNAEDEPGYHLLQNHWQEACTFINYATKDGKGKCLVHCVAGMNRSALIVAAHYMLTTKTPVLETVMHIRKQRGNVALCNEGFQQQLVAMARLNGLLGDELGRAGSFVPHAPPPAGYNLATSTSSLPSKDNPLDKLASR